MLSSLRQLHPIIRNSAWWQGNHSTGKKLAYYPAILSSYFTYMTSRHKRINYLGSKLTYDNIASPLTLMYYPHEISKKILSNIDKPIGSLLDIGGNIGQFSITFNHLSPKTKIDSFEPNLTSFEILGKNVAGKSNIKIYNYGIGPNKKQRLYFSPTQTGIGSLLPDNSQTAITKNLQETTIQTINNVSNYTKRKNYDLIKVDVEGYEYNVIKNLKGLKTKYLFIEMSGHKRDKDASNSKVLAEIKSVFGPYDIINISEATVDSMCYDMLLLFKND